MNIKALTRQYWPTAALFVAMIAAWQLAVSTTGIREYLLPAPLSVWNAMWFGEIAWAQHLWTTTWEIIGAFVMAAVVGVALGVAIAWSPLLANALVPFLVFVNIRIPNALPYILSALKITATAAVVGAIVGEFVASQKGLGYVIVTTQSSMNTPVAFAALVWISLLGLLLFGFVALLSRLLVP